MYIRQTSMMGKYSARYRSGGFTLIELMIVVAIIGILAGIVYPSYQNHMREARRSDAYTGLSRMADLQERYYLQNRTYATNAELAQVGGANTVEGYYTLSVAAADRNTYTLQADVVATRAQAADTDCPTLTINQAGTKLPANCWK